ncbi:MAG: hypothetical protein Q9167_002382 [Letrouitia subvulpina]
MAHMEVHYNSMEKTSRSKMRSILDTGSSREPFTITLAGQTFYVLSSSVDVAAAYRQTIALTFDGFLRDLMVQFGLSKSAVQKMWDVPSHHSTPKRAANPLYKPLAHVAEDLYKQQLLPGDHLESLSTKFVYFINQELHWNNMSGIYDPVTNLYAKQTHLLNWCGHVMVSGATNALFGTRLGDIEPNFVQTFLDFDEAGWMLIYRLPRFAAGRMFNAKERLTAALEQYFRTPVDQRLDSAWLVTILEQEQRHCHIDDQDIAKMFLMIYWVRETQPAVHDDGSLDINFLIQNCPQLDALYNEVLRFYNAASSVRQIESTVKIGGKILRKGNKVLMPFRQLHFNEDSFGINAARFDSERFLKKNDLSKRGDFRPFGGGTTLCPGRFIAKREVFAFIALVLSRYNINILAKKSSGGRGIRLPQPQEGKPTMGILSPRAGDDLEISVQQRRCRDGLEEAENIDYQL